MSHNIVKNAVFKTLLTMLNIAVPLLVGPYIARVLDVELYAYYNQAISVLAWFIPFATFGVYNYAIREISFVKNDKTQVERSFSKFFIISICATIATTIVYLVIINSSVDKAIITIYYILIIELIAQGFNVEWMNEADENYRFILVKTVIVKSLYIVSIFVFIRDATHIYQYTAIAASSVLLNYLLSFGYIKSKLKFVKIPLHELLDLIKPLLIMLLLTNANMLFTYLDRLFLVMSDTAIVESTYYQLSLAIASLITQVISSVLVVTIPRLSKTIIQSIDDYKSILNNSAHCFFMIAFPVVFGLTVLGPEAMLIYGGEKYAIAGVTLQLFAIRMIPCLFDRVLSSQILFVNKKERQIAKLYLITGGINLLLNTILLMTNMINANNLVITTMISESILVLLQLYEVQKLHNAEIKVIDKDVLKYAILSGLMALLLLLLKHFFFASYSGIKSAILISGMFVFVGCVFYFIGLIITKDKYLKK